MALTFGEAKSISSTQVRTALYESTHKFFGHEMACAVEAFEEILMYLHRESVQYQKSLENLSTDGLNDSECAPLCISHQNFELKTCDESFCCDFSEISEIQSDFFLRVYISELETQLAIIRSINKEASPDIDLMIGSAIRDDLHHNSKKRCPSCGIKPRVTRR